MTKPTATRRQWLKSAGGSLAWLAACQIGQRAFAAGSYRLDYDIVCQRAARFHENGDSWLHARVGALPAAGEPPAAIATMNHYAAHVYSCAATISARAGRRQSSTTAAEAMRHVSADRALGNASVDGTF